MSTTSKRVRRLLPAVVGWLVAMGALVMGLVLTANRTGKWSRLGRSRRRTRCSSSAVGAFILVRRPGHGIGRVCLIAGIFVSVGILGSGLADTLA